MEEASSLPVPDPVNPGKNRRRQQITVLIICLLIATALWFLRAFENEYTTRVDHPVRYVNMPDKMITLNQLPQRISLEVKGLGFAILKHNWNFSKNPLIIDIRSLKSVPARRKKGFVEYLPMNQYFNNFTSQLKDLKVVAIMPDTLIFRFAYTKTRRFKVNPTLVYEAGTAAVPDSLVRVNPDSVEVEGPDLMLDTLHSIPTLPIRINRQDIAFSRSLGLKEVHKLVKTRPARVIVTISKKF
jgi:hypothetical protein